MTAIESLTRALLASRFLRFGIVGACGFVIDTSIFFVLHDLAGLSPYVARAFSILIAMSGTWFGNRTLTFREHAATGGRAVLREWLTFAAANAIGNTSNYLTFSALITFASPPFNNRYLALVAGTAVGMVLNFTLSKRIVFRAAS
ncbi:MAG TPA: GtrA family protein [Rhizomicrobium sp.]|nr:GtrA family protein [Rhizomicrobium sp.]